MSSSRRLGTSLEATSSAACLSNAQLALQDGFGTNCTTGVLVLEDTNRLDKTDTLSHFSLGPC
jgi:hypothetical protein